MECLVLAAGLSLRWVRALHEMDSVRSDDMKIAGLCFDICCLFFSYSCSSCPHGLSRLERRGGS